MSEAIKPTPGPWLTHREGFSTIYIQASIGGGWFQEIAACGPTNDGSAQQEANARLIAEAGTVFHITGMTPMQLVERVKELEGALNGITEMCEMHGDFRNGVTDPTGTIDEGNVVAGRVIQSCRAALAKCQGGKE